MQEEITLEQEITNLKARIEELEKLNRWYIEQLKLSRQKMFGKSTENSEHADEVNLFNEAETTREAIAVEPDIEKINSYERKKSNRGEKIKNLPVETVEYKLTAQEAVCSACSNDLHIMSKEVRKELTIIPAKVKVIEHVSYVYSCRNCEKNNIETTIVTAKAPKALLAKSLVSAELLAYIMSQKFVNSLPLYRQEQEFKRLGVELSRQNLSNWIIKGAALLEPLIKKLKQEMLSHQVLHADETTLEVLCEPGRPAQTKSYMWVYRTSGDTKKSIILYDYQQGRSGLFAREYLAGYSGYLHSDGWIGYRHLEEQGVILCGCWAHARRKFHEALVGNNSGKKDSLENIGLSYCNKLFAIEKRAENMSAEERYKFREKESVPVLEAFFEWISNHKSAILPQSLLGKAFTYAQNQKKYLSAFLVDGRIEISNNRAERSIKPFVIGRKNWLFCNTPGGATSSAVIYSIIQTAIENSLKPQEYLEYIFKQIQQNNFEIETLLPCSPQLPNSLKMIRH